MIDIARMIFVRLFLAILAGIALGFALAHLAPRLIAGEQPRITTQSYSEISGLERELDSTP